MPHKISSDKKTSITAKIQASIKTKEALLDDANLLGTVETCIALITDAFKNNRKVFFCGNGGSAADAQHLAAEFSGKFYLDRDPLFSEALHVNTSYLTAVANDYGYEETYARLVNGKGSKGDILIGLSTSGNSPNIVKALKTAQEINMITIGFTGETGGEMKTHCDHIIAAPSKDTPRIQECHMLIGHIICEYVEKNIYG